ncbi:MAG: hypothetical protein IJU57_06180 [Clostridia bacterium]|nr:hypothetical protein [Clostridia bacterium]
MKEDHVFSEEYSRRKHTVMCALRREEAAGAATISRRHSGTAVRILVCAAVLAALTVSVFAITRFIDFRVSKEGSEVSVHAGTTASDPDSAPVSANTPGNNGTGTADEEKPLRSWRSQDGEISVCLSIPDIPSDMLENTTASGKYGSQDRSRRITICGIDLRRSDLDQIVSGATDTMQLDAGGKIMYVIKKGEADFYDRVAYIAYEEEELILKLYVSYGITDAELLSLASSITVGYTTDTLLAIPIENEIETGPAGKTSYETGYVPVLVTELKKTGTPLRADTGWFTLTVSDVSVHDNVSALDPSNVLRAEYIGKFTDGDGALVPYNRTEVFLTAGSGETLPSSFGETVSVTKKLYVLTLTLTDVQLDEFTDEDKYSMICAIVASLKLNGYTVKDGRAEITSLNAVIDRLPGEYSSFSEPVYREDLGNGRWRVAYLVDEDIAEGDLMLYDRTQGIFVKIQ